MRNERDADTVKGPMDLMLLRVFQEHFLLQCKFALLAADDLKAALKERRDADVLRHSESAERVRKYF